MWTPEQDAVFDAVRNTHAHVCVEAVAGAGKTTTVVQAAGQAVGNVGFVAFNRHIAGELQTRLNGSATACTLHSLGLRACRRHWPNMGEPDERKPETLLQALKPQWFWKGRDGRQRPGDEAQTAIKLMRLCKYTLTDPSCLDDLDELVEHHNLDLGFAADSIYTAVADLIERCQTDVSSIDYDDMIWLPVVKNLGIDPYDLLFVDETQDLNRCQQQLVRAAGKRLVIVGDSRQAIYGFSGSDCEALVRFRAELNDCADRPLTVTFRCPRSHVELARRIVPAIQPATNAVQGVVGQIDPDDIGSCLLPGDLVVCRCNAPLVGLAYSLILAGVPATMRGRDIGRGLIELINLLKADDPADLARKLDAYRDKERLRLERRSASEQAIQSMEDRVGCLAQLCSQVDSIDALRFFIGSVFSDEQTKGTGQLVLSSIHRAKGLESDRVVIAAPEKLPLVRRNARDWEITQELNLLYIAVTRARRELIFAGDVPAPLGCASFPDPVF